MHGQRQGMPLQLLVSGSIVASMLLLALFLIGSSYYSYRSTLIAASSGTARQLAENLDTHVQRLLQPIEGTLRLLSYDPLSQATTLEARRERLPVLVQSLEANPVLSAVYAGYPDGSFLLLRTLHNNAARDAVSAPRRAHYLLQSVEHDSRGERLRGLWQFYDARLQLLETRDKPDYDYDPRNRPWYQGAQHSAAVHLTLPYVFYTTGEIGVTLALRDPRSGTVLGVDASVSDLSDVIAELKPQPEDELAVINEHGRVVAYSDLRRIVQLDPQQGLQLVSLQELAIPVLSQVADDAAAVREMHRYDTDQGVWYGMKVPLQTAQKVQLTVLFAVPENSLLADARAQGVRQLLWTAAIILLLLLSGWRLGRFVARPLRQLSDEVEALINFDFSRKVEIASPVREVNRLGDLIGQMATAINSFQVISRTLAREPDLDLMLNRVTDNLVAITSAQAGVVYLLDAESRQLKRATRVAQREVPAQLSAEGGVEPMREAVRRALSQNDDQVLTTLLRGREGELLGVLGLSLPAGEVDQEAFSHFVDEVSGSAATAIETRLQVEAQKALIDAIIRLLADAIDAKSPYTSGHCERVPQLAELLLNAAERSSRPAFKGFTLSAQQRDEFRIAAWLHDCGKITSPEYVVDKATKLETIYNRIHEVRTRFEVLWRDADIRYLQGRLDGGIESDLRNERIRCQRQLQQDFAFIAECNHGSEFLAPEHIERLQQLAAQPWLRHFDKRLGLSQEEYERLPAAVHDEELPVPETLLADLPEHRVGWGERRPPVERDNPANQWGFDMELPACQANFGELYNLSVQRGTLTDEERFRINDHIVQTICMLSRLPLPPELKRIPEIAGNHHERIDGGGYPRRLPASVLTIPERVMAIADIFEALTASDRPYKAAKTLSESLRIMAFMVRDGHIDPDLFALMLDQEIYLDYAERFLQPEQIDLSGIDKRQLLRLATAD